MLYISDRLLWNLDARARELRDIRLVCLTSPLIGGRRLSVCECLVSALISQARKILQAPLTGHRDWFATRVTAETMGLKLLVLLVYWRPMTVNVREPVLSADSSSDLSALEPAGRALRDMRGNITTHSE